MDVCRLYLDAPRLYQHGELVLCVDEKTGIQALERARADHGRGAGPAGAARPGVHPARHADCLLATLVVPTGQVIGGVTQRRATWDYVRHVRDVVEQFPDANRAATG